MFFSNPEALGRVVRARSILIQEQPFYGVLALYLEPVERPDVETMAVDGRHLFYAPDFVMSLPDAELIGVIAHEVSHVALLHHARIGNRDLKRFNRAADFAINGDLLRQGFKLPKGMLIEARFADVSAEEIYDVLAQEDRREQEQAGKAGQNGAGQNGSARAGNAPAGAGAPASGQPGDVPSAGDVNGIGGIMRPGDGGEADASAQAEEWRVRVVEAAAVARRANAGTLPAGIARIAEANGQARMDVRAALAAFIDSSVVTQTTWSRPNRRTIGQGIYLPTQIVDGLEHVIYAIDDSGSIDGHMLANASAEVEAAHADGRIQRLTVLFADTRVHTVAEIEVGDDFPGLKPKAGGGGTRFADTFATIARDYPDATAVIYLTDLLVSDQAAWIEPACPVLFAVHGDSRRFDAVASACPFGEPVYIGRLE